MPKYFLLINQFLVIMIIWALSVIGGWGREDNGRSTYLVGIFIKNLFLESLSTTGQSLK